ncbi:unnamed protein product [Prorocentrum cordatum]|uniref:Secreted protein n=1 Tax=Prorocentrum cordatum TaxID=2364126 RepID=A0ABN9UWT0_9DINO|nr:unnamed protein product [Polarella glacialis]
MCACICVSPALSWPCFKCTDCSSFWPRGHAVLPPPGLARCPLPAVSRRGESLTSSAATRKKLEGPSELCAPLGLRTGTLEGMRNLPSSSTLVSFLGAGGTSPA